MELLLRLLDRLSFLADDIVDVCLAFGALSGRD